MITCQKFIALICLIAFLFFSSNSCTRTSKTSPNMVFIMTDDQGYRDAGFMGHPHLQTPNLDAMANNGLRLDRFYANPVCSPTRASFLTGRHPNRTAVFAWGHALRPQEDTFVAQLQQAGYRTGFFGKWHLGSVRAESDTNPGVHGFDEWVAAPNFYLNDPWMSRNGNPVQFKGESSVVTAELALEFIEEAAAGDAPFLVFIWTGSPHDPHRATPELQALYPDLPDDQKNYYGEISGIDMAVGMVRDRLRELDLAEQTIVLFTSDNGGRTPLANNGELRGSKGDLWEGGIRVPTVIEWPGKIAPRISDVPSGIVDLYPTFLELANVEPVEPVLPKDGISLVPLLNSEMHHRETPMRFWRYFGVRGQRMRSDEIVLDLEKYQRGELELEDLNEGRLNTPDMPYDDLEQRPGMAAWIDGDWKLYKDRDESLKLFNLAEDPGESVNLIEEHPDLARRMHYDLNNWQDSVINSIRGWDYK